MKNRFLGFGIASAVIFAFVLTACGELEDDARVIINVRQIEEEGNPIGEDDPDFQLMGWYWEKQTYDEFSYTWNFRNDGTVSVIHCCGTEYYNQFSYSLDGDVLFTYGGEMNGSKAEAGKITFTEKNGIVKLIRENGTVFIRRGQADPDPYFRADYKRPIKPQGTWQNDDLEFIFNGNDELLINALSEEDSALRPGRYRYLAKNEDWNDHYLVIRASFAEGEKADVWLYKYGSFSQNSSKLSLISLNKDGINYILTRGGVK